MKKRTTRLLLLIALVNSNQHFMIARAIADSESCAQSSKLFSKTLSNPCATDPQKPKRPATPTSDLSSFPALVAYRWLSGSDEHRQCRLHPTCSGFMAKSIANSGWRGLLWGLARVQMSHDHQDGRLNARLASDGYWIYDDDLQNWY